MTEVDLNKIFQLYFKDPVNTPVSDQLESFNMFINVYLPQIVSNAQIEITKNNTKYSITFDNVYVDFPHFLNNSTDNTPRPLYPMNARNMSESYLGTVYCDVIETKQYFDVEGKNDKAEMVNQTVHRSPRVIIGQIPIMIQSCKCNLYNLPKELRIRHGECENDVGGYFIINGIERVITAQMRAANNVVNVIVPKESEKYKYSSEIRSMSAETGHSVLMSCVISVDKRNIYFRLPSQHIKEPIPIGIVFKALGYNNKDILDFIGLKVNETENDEISKYYRFILRDCFSIQDCYGILSQEKDISYEEAIKLFNTLSKEKQTEYRQIMQDKAISEISKYIISNVPIEKHKAFTWQIVENELFPHLGASSTIKEKAVFLGYMVRKLLLVVLEKRNIDDRDNYTNKRVDTCGALCMNLFRTIFKRFVETIKSEIDKRTHEPDIIPLINKNTMVSKNILSCFATGNWGIQKSNSYIVTGVSQLLDRMTYKAFLSHLRRVTLPISKEGKSSEMRNVRSSQWGFVDPYETPEGKKTGSVMNKSMFCRITNRVNIVDIKDIVEKLFLKNMIFTNYVQIPEIKNLTQVMVNGSILGFVEKSYISTFITKFKKNKIIMTKKMDISIVYDKVDNDIRIMCDEGRFSRPLLVVKNNKLLLEEYDIDWDKTSFTELVNCGIISYIDAAEQEQSVIAMDLKGLSIQNNNYCEIHPITMMGVVAGAIPWSNCTPSPRICYQSSMGKQALGVPMLNYNIRADTVLYILSYPQKQIVSTSMSREIGYDEMPSGVNVVIAVASMGGGNSDDGLIINKGAVDRGLFNLSRFFTITDDEKKHRIIGEEKICLPPVSSDVFKRLNGNYSKLDKNGLPRIGAKLVKGDIVIGKISIVIDKDNKKEIIKDISKRIDSPSEEGIVDRVNVYKNQTGQKVIKIVMRNFRILQLGDKLASGCAQKGTIGQIIQHEDMPFSSSGIVPDVVINALAFPSRMTINMLIEIILGKKCAMTGEYGDATPYVENNYNAAKRICDELAKHKCDKYGWETMYCGTTGEQFEADIYMGISYYQRLKHQVDDKEHARSTGNITSLTRQSVDGRALQGGMRLGNMEVDCLVSHGVPRILHDRLFVCSDKNYMYVCAACGRQVNDYKECCTVCNHDKIVKCVMPFSSKLLMEELNSALIDTRFMTA